MLQVQGINIIEKTIEYVKQTLFEDSSGHDWWHVYRVWKMAKRIQLNYPHTDKNVVELSALLHDIADWKKYGANSKVATMRIQKWLSEFPDINKKQISHICHIVDNISYKRGKCENHGLSIEGQIVQDADRLDAMGAIGIARTFAYGGYKGHLMYEPKSSENIVHNSHTSVDHFYEKLLIIKNLMNTEFARNLAQKRHEFMEEYLSQFYSECDGQI